MSWSRGKRNGHITAEEYTGATAANDAMGALLRANTCSERVATVGVDQRHTAHELEQKAAAADAEAKDKPGES